MSYPTTHIRWADVLERKDPKVLPFLRFYREVGLVPEVSPPKHPENSMDRLRALRRSFGRM